MTRTVHWSAPWALLGLVAACGGEPEARPNLLFVSIDTLRADRLGCYGCERPTSPNLDALAARGVRFDPVIAESSWTIPSHVSMLSGLSPRSHGVELPMQRIADETVMLAETLHDAGYMTFGLTDGGWLSEAWGFDQGFDSFDGDGRQGLGRIVERAREYVTHAESRDAPWFAFLHTYDAHCPYEPPENYRRLFASPDAIPFPTAGLCGNPTFNSLPLEAGHRQHLVDLYDAGVRWVDEVLGAFIAWLEAQGLLETTVVVITSDHGEELFEHERIGHGTTLYREVLDVPWILLAPGVAPRVVDGPAALADIAPTVLELMGLEPEAPMDGRSWVPALRGDALEASGAYSRVRWEASLEAWSQPEAQLVRELDGSAASAFDLLVDPLQRAPLDASGLAEELDAHLARPAAHAPQGELRSDLSERERARLESLGYFGD